MSTKLKLTNSRIVLAVGRGEGEHVDKRQAQRLENYLQGTNLKREWEFKVVKI